MRPGTGFGFVEIRNKSGPFAEPWVHLKHRTSMLCIRHEEIGGKMTSSAKS